MAGWSGCSQKSQHLPERALFHAFPCYPGQLSHLRGLLFPLASLVFLSPQEASTLLAVLSVPLLTHRSKSDVFTGGQIILTAPFTKGCPAGGTFKEAPLLLLDFTEAQLLRCARSSEQGSGRAAHIFSPSPQMHEHSRMCSQIQYLGLAAQPGVMLPLVNYRKATNLKIQGAVRKK